MKTPAINNYTELMTPQGAVIVLWHIRQNKPISLSELYRKIFCDSEFYPSYMGTLGDSLRLLLDCGLVSSIGNQIENRKEKILDSPSQI